ncbi:MAG: S1/P1 Nuclease [Chitinophagaceae bacterium]|nr:S1/P1 Nuclease [Chitinophagaceae bacterium]
MKHVVSLILCVLLTGPAFCWGFYGHKKINFYACFLLPPEMLVFYKANISFITEHAVDPDKRRYLVDAEGPRHYIDIDRYGSFPYPDLPRKWNDAVAKYSEDSLQQHGIVPWWIQTMLYRLTTAFRQKSGTQILKLSAELGHYIGDAHVPLHTSSNHNGQYTNQRGIHGFWESRIPELLAETEWDFFIGRASYVREPLNFMWDRILESAKAADSVLRIEEELNKLVSADQKYAYENRNGVLLKQYSSYYSRRYNSLLNNMVERRMRQSISSVASFWYTAWVDAGQPALNTILKVEFDEQELKALDSLGNKWQNSTIKGKDCF